MSRRDFEEYEARRYDKESEWMPLSEESDTGWALADDTPLARDRLRAWIWDQEKYKIPYYQMHPLLRKMVVRKHGYHGLRHNYNKSQVLPLLKIFNKIRFWNDYRKRVKKEKEAKRKQQIEEALMFFGTPYKKYDKNIRDFFDYNN